MLLRLIKFQSRLFLAILIGLGLSELFLRIFWSGPKPSPVEWRPGWVPSGADPVQASLYNPDSVLGWKHKPDSSALINRPCFSTNIAFNSMGTRDELTDLISPNGIFIGDSFFEGLQVDHKDLVDEVVEEKTGLKFINFGTAGYGPDQYLAVYKKFVAYSPKSISVIVGLYLGNDLRNLSRSLEEKANGRPSPKVFWDENMANNLIYKQNGSPIISIESPESPPIWKRLGRNFFLYHFTGTALHRFGILKYDLPIDFHLYLVPPSHDWLDSWEVLDKILDEFKRISLARNDALLFVLIPDPLEVAPPGLRRATLRQFKIPVGQQFELKYPRMEIKKILDHKGVRFVDLYHPISAQIGDQGFYSVYLRCDPHWGPEVMRSQLVR